METIDRLFEVALGSPVIAPIKRRLEEGDFLSLNCVADAGKPFVVALLARISNRPVLVVTDGLTSQERFFNDLQAFLPEALFYPAWETLPHEDSLPQADTIADRLKVVGRLCEPACASAPLDRSGLQQPVIVASAQALMQRTFSARALAADRFPIRPGQRLERDELISALTGLGYSLQVQASEPGDMAVRGGVVDFFPLDREWPVRAELAGEIVESIREFDPVTQESRQNLEAVVVTPAGEFAILKRAPEKSAPLPELLPRSTLLVLDEPARLAEAAEKYAPQIPEGDRLFVPWQEILQSGLATVDLCEAPSIDPPAACLNLGVASLEAFRPLDVRAPEPELAERMRRSFFDQMRRWAEEGYRLHLVCGTDSERQRFEELWREQFQEIPASLTVHRACPLSRGWLWPEAKLAVVTDAEVFGRYKLLRPRRKHRPMAQPVDWTELQEGDFVVHVQHGIGEYLGLQQLDFNGTTQEVLAIKYANDARLYVPLDQAHLLSKYIGPGRRIPKLHELGSGLWQRQKFRAERAIMDLAAELLEVQAARETLHGHAFSPDTPWQREFEAAFPYEETPDQLTAIEEVKRDMESRKPMDRLICGDAGYGKTEVAIRAAFKAVMDGFQVAVLVPTTVLAEQHFRTFRDRMAGYPLHIEMLSRFRSRATQKKILAALRHGAIDIIIGTHRLLSPDVQFKNLGLVVIDEEQRFGVLHKERFKQLRTLVDVLTLTATPIPRTLYLALTGARDLSTIETPPQDRLPIETIIAPYDERLIRQAIQRELSRGGQVYVLHNRVQTIETVADRLRKMFETDPVRIAVAHGQMSEQQLQSVMRRFVKGHIDVLVSTTIIENGLDIPNANTIIIDRADRFGLAELYQLRGRVGRSRHQAYAYILLPRHIQLLHSARKRISAIRQYSSPGSGFKIAMRDLEIRGAGNILGPEQSGHIAAIGFELYCQLLKESIARLKGQPVKRIPRVTLRLDFLAAESGQPLARIPCSYIPDDRLRISAYRKLAQASDLTELHALRRQLLDRYGRWPGEVELLLQCAELRLLAARANIDTVETRAEKILLSQRGQLFQPAGRFPRLQGTQPEEKLADLKQLLQSLGATAQP